MFDAHNKYEFISIGVIVAIIVILVGISQPLLTIAGEKTSSQVCADNLKQLGKAFAMYRLDWGGNPPSQTNWDPVDWAKVGWTWTDALYPYFEKNRYVMDCPGNGLESYSYASQDVWVDYAMNAEITKSLVGDDWNEKAKLSYITKPHSEVLLLIETRRYGEPKGGSGVFKFFAWSEDDLARDIGDAHEEGVGLLWVDGHVSYLKKSELLQRVTPTRYLVGYFLEPR